MTQPLRIRSDVEVDGSIDSVGDTPWLWPTGAWAGLTVVQIGTSPNTYTLTTPNTGSVFNVQRGRLTYAAGGDGNDHKFYVWPEARRNSRIRGTWYDHSIKTVGAPGVQMGYCHRLRTDPDGITRAFVVRHDITFGQDHIVQAGLWRWTPGGVLTLDANDVGTFPGLTGIVRTINIAAASRTGNVVTATGITDPVSGFTTTLIGGHTYTANFPDAGYNVTFIATNGTQWPQVAADDPGSGAGTVNDLDGVFPLNVDSIMQGPTLSVKAWRTSQPEPSWGDPAFNLVMRQAAVDPYPDAEGRKGLVVCHAGVAGMFAEWGPIERGR